MKQPLDHEKINIAVVGSSQANCAIDENIVLQELNSLTNVGAVVDLHFPGSTPHSVLETCQHYKIAERFDRIVYYITDRDFYIKRAYPVQNLANRRGLSQKMFEIFPNWMAASLRERMFSEVFRSPTKSAWSERKDKLSLLRESLSRERNEASEEAVRELLSYCERSGTQLIVCVGWSHPEVDLTGGNRELMESSLVRLTRKHESGIVYRGREVPKEEDFKDWTHTKVAFQAQYSKKVAKYIAHQID